MTARVLSTAAGWHEAKTSRIESAKQAPGEDDIRIWCRVCGAERQIPDLIAASRAADSMYIEWRRLNRAGMRRPRRSGDRCTSGRGFSRRIAGSRAGIPANPCLRRGSAVGDHRVPGIPDDVEEAVRGTDEQEPDARSGNHRFALLVEESVLRYRIGSADVLAGQLGYLLEASELPSVSLGIIPFSATDVLCGRWSHSRSSTMSECCRAALGPGHGYRAERDHSLRPRLRKARQLAVYGPRHVP